MAESKSGILLKAVRRIRGGVGVMHNKITADKETVRLSDPGTVILPMLQHKGEPCIPTVKKGDYVLAGQKIGDSNAYMSAPVHASVSGWVRDICEITLADGRACQAVRIAADKKIKLLDSIAPPAVNTKKELVSAIRESGLVGLGGAGVPTHTKLDLPDDKFVDTLIINAAECEPYITTDHRECIENSWDIMGGIYSLVDIYGFKNVIIAVEDNKPAAIKALKEIAEKDCGRECKIGLMTLKSRYPAGAEKLLIYAATGRIVKEGAVSADAGCLVLNISSVAFISRYLKTGKPLISRTVTVSGSSIRKPMNVRVPIGTSIAKIIDFCGGFIVQPHKIIAGGPMMGTALEGTDIPLIKSTNAVLAFSKESAKIKPEADCIHCGKCHSACPMGLIPVLIEKYAEVGNTRELSRLGAAVCMECGCCAYACPAGRPLIQHMRLAKKLSEKGGITE